LCGHSPRTDPCHGSPTLPPFDGSNAAPDNGRSFISSLHRRERLALGRSCRSRRMRHTAGFVWSRRLGWQIPTTGSGPPRRYADVCYIGGLRVCRERPVAARRSKPSVFARGVPSSQTRPKVIACAIDPAAALQQTWVSWKRSAILNIILNSHRQLASGLTSAQIPTLHVGFARRR
jgi:hypothetical protein